MCDDALLFLISLFHSCCLLLLYLKVRSTDFGNFLHVALNETLSLENSSDYIDSGKKMKFPFFSFIISVSGAENGHNSSMFGMIKEMHGTLLSFLKQVLL